jgi:hypothetical protein
MMQIGTQKTLFRQYGVVFLVLGLVVIAGGKADKFSFVLSFGAGNICLGPSDRGFSEKS